MVAKEVSDNIKIKNFSNMITAQVSYYVWKMHNLQTIDTPKKAKE